MHDETALVNLAKGNDRKAFRQLYELHVDPLYRFLHRFASDEHELEEWVQSAFIKAFRGIASFDGRSKFSSWLFRIAINEGTSPITSSRLREFYSMKLQILQSMIES